MESAGNYCAGALDIEDAVDGQAGLFDVLLSDVVGEFLDGELKGVDPLAAFG